MENKLNKIRFYEDNIMKMIAKITKAIIFFVQDIEFFIQDKILHEKISLLVLPSFYLFKWWNGKSVYYGNSMRYYLYHDHAIRDMIQNDEEDDSCENSDRQDNTDYVYLAEK